MHWTDTAIILSTRKHGESAGIVSLLSAEHGKFHGLVRGIAGKTQRGIFQPGNVVEATWRGRLSEHLGNFTAELHQPYAALLLTQPQPLAAMHAACSLLDATLPEREPAPLLFAHTLHLLEQLTHGMAWEKDYILLELELLSHAGFRLDLESCAATGTTEGLAYISPKSGRAVSAPAGEPYKDKLFPLPGFFTAPHHLPSADEITTALRISAYFLEKYVFAPHNAKLPVARLRLGEMLLNNVPATMSCLS